MRKDNITVGIVFGGKSREHDVSIESARAICQHIDRDRYTPRLIYINKEGNWAFIEEEALMQAEAYRDTGLIKGIPEHFFSISPWDSRSPVQAEIDIYFPILHGPNGEDGKIQGLWELAGKPYVGANSFASALAMDKGVAKALFQRAGLPTPGFLIFSGNNETQIKQEVSQHFHYPVFVKPCSLGSSVGISKVKKEDELIPAVRIAFQYDKKIIIEQGLDAREIEISVMGNDEVLVSPPGELIPANEFYDYADKYLEGKTQFIIPAHLSEETESQIKGMAEAAYRTLSLNGMSRIDFFVEKGSQKVYINEINTIPGFTEISMFPRLFGLMGISFTELVSRLIEYGFEYHENFGD
jgi:D-alanine-D-alanine ligase